MTLQQAKSALLSHSNSASAEAKRIFFKNCQGDIFLGVKAALVKKVAKEFLALELEEIEQLIQSDVHEERSLANVLLCLKYRKANEIGKKEIFDFYVENRHYIRDWDGVDDSAPYIVGCHLLEKDKKLLYELSLSKVIWDRRIAIVSTWWFIRHGHLQDTFNLVELLLQDKEDLIHKACGWMLREAGKREIHSLRQFLDKHHKKMPRTMLRYAIERFPAEERKQYLVVSKSAKADLHQAVFRQILEENDGLMKRLFER